ncbi:MAG: hypothetical protein O3A55_03150 [Bacteroidetes bacterium]|nr:hypothetical protein [Bacteroidota bacterium]
MTENFFFKLLVGITTLLLIIGAIIIKIQNNYELLSSIIIAAIINLASILFVFFMTRKALKTSSQNFGNFVLGGMVARIFFLSGSLLIAILIFKINAFSLAISTIFFYLAYLILELFYIGFYNHRK